MSVNINYLAELASNRTMNSYDTTFMEPNISGSSNVTIPNYSTYPEDSSRIKFNFTMPNIGNVTANCSDIQYYSTDQSAAGENKWWKYYTNGSSLYKEHIEYTPPISGTGLNSILSCIETDNGYSLTKDTAGNGFIVLNYDLTSDSTYNFGGHSSNSIGQMTVTINVGDNDTKDDLINKLQSNFNPTSIVDVYEEDKNTNTSSPAYSEVFGAEANPHTINVPVYKSTNDLKIQAGATENQSIDIIYNTLRSTDLGIDDIDTLTNSNSTNAINALDGAIGIVNTQRAVFGAYQNELQRANDNVTNSSLNLQSSNSKIKDADMAKEMLKYSKKGILEQASLSLFSQGIKKSTSVLDLLTL